MRPVAPRIPDGVELTYPGSDRFLAITITIRDLAAEGTPGVVGQVTRWTMTADERQRIAAGEDIYVQTLRGDDGLITPLFATVGWP